jgi:glycosyltransferase involved in cell wall biosynthesis
MQLHDSLLGQLGIFVLEAKNHISVCIPTYKRPAMLSKLLGELQNQVTNGLFTYSIVVVDNDFNESAKSIVDEWKRKSLIRIVYYNEPEQNIAIARNKAVENAKGDFIAFIDDDEFPNDEWLLNLYKTFHEFRADGILGPVKPHFEKEPPKWIIKGRLCDRESFPTGTIIQNPKYTRTGNVLLNKQIFVENGRPFDPRFGRTGGEDVEFFKSIIQRGNILVWCQEASVKEIVPPERLKRSYFLRRALLRGVVNSEKVSLLSSDILRSVMALILYTLALPVFLLVRHDLFMKYLIKDCDHLGKLLGIWGLKIVKERNF